MSKIIAAICFKVILIMERKLERHPSEVSFQYE